jgi:hypothetical protein
MPSYGKLLEDTRDGMLDAIADAIENHKRNKSSVEKASPRGLPVQSPQEGDFLYDFLRLNVQYVNQLARLGSSYSIIASRALERMYDRFVAKDEARDVPKPKKGDPNRKLLGDSPYDPAPLRIHGRLGEQISAAFEVKNWLDRPATIHVRCDDAFPDGSAPISFLPSLRYGQVKSRKELELVLDAHDCVELTLSLTPTRKPDGSKLRPEGNYQGVIIVEAEKGNGRELGWTRDVIVHLDVHPDDR